MSKESEMVLIDVGHKYGSRPTTNGYIGNPFDGEYPDIAESQQQLSGGSISVQGGILGGGRISQPLTHPMPYPGYKQPYYAPETSYEWGAFPVAQASVTLNGMGVLPWRIPSWLLK
jgi:hypothetical protein